MLFEAFCRYGYELLALCIQLSARSPQFALDSGRRRTSLTLRCDALSGVCKRFSLKLVQITLLL
jgi:hypothetical protein